MDGKKKEERKNEETMKGGHKFLFFKEKHE